MTIRESFNEDAKDYVSRKEYCTQNDGVCEDCSLVNYGRDCMNNPCVDEPEPVEITKLSENIFRFEMGRAESMDGGDRKSSGHFDHLKEPEKTAEKIGKEVGQNDPVKETERTSEKIAKEHNGDRKTMWSK